MEGQYLNLYLPQMRREEQITSSHCGPAVVKMLLSFLGIHTTQLDITKAAGVTRTIEAEGTAVEDLALGVHKLYPNLVQFWVKKNSSISDLEQLANYYHYPIGIGWQGIFGEFSDGYDDHYAVATHIDESSGQIYIADPYRAFAGQDRILRISLFEKRWWSYAEGFDYRTGNAIEVEEQKVCFMITRKNEDFPQMFKMLKL